MRKDRFLVELSILTILTLLAAASCSIPAMRMLKAQDQAKEKETITAFKQVKVALERYAADHDGQYPRYIWGGDREGWDAYYSPATPRGTKTDIYDPLIRYGYLDEYPKNPFITNGLAVIELTSSNGTQIPGEGDPRFGFNGDRMGNGLSDPRYPECDHTLGGASNGKWGGGSSATIPADPSGTWTMGGWWNEKQGKTVSTHWPGCFFYRSGGDMGFLSKNPPKTKGVARYGFATSGMAAGDARTIVRVKRVDRYILGIYGSSITIGYDTLRTGDYHGNIGGAAFNGMSGWPEIRHYGTGRQSTGNQDYPIMFPECMGGGADGSAPRWPYTDPLTGEWLFGSPDGSPDGVVWVTTSDINESEEER